MSDIIEEYKVNIWCMSSSSKKWIDVGQHYKNETCTKELEVISNYKDNVYSLVFRENEVLEIDRISEFGNHVGEVLHNWWHTIEGKDNDHLLVDEIMKTRYPYRFGLWEAQHKLNYNVSDDFFTFRHVFVPNKDSIETRYRFIDNVKHHINNFVYFCRMDREHFDPLTGMENWENPTCKYYN